MCAAALVSGCENNVNTKELYRARFPIARYQIIYLKSERLSVNKSSAIVDNGEVHTCSVKVQVVTHVRTFLNTDYVNAV